MSSIATAETLLVAVQFIGYRQSFRDHLYGTGLTFEKGQIRNLPPDLARKLLRHHDLFKKADAAMVAPKPAAPSATTEGTNMDPETAEAVARVEREKREQSQVQSNLQDLYDSVNVMDKGALSEFAMTRYRQDLNKRLSVDKLRAQVIGFIDQFGAI